MKKTRSGKWYEGKLHYICISRVVLSLELVYLSDFRVTAIETRFGPIAVGVRTNARPQGVKNYPSGDGGIQNIEIFEHLTLHKL